MAKAQPTSWRDVLKIHPAADLFPMMSDEELFKLGADIKMRGLREPVACFEGQLLDGRNRLDAMASVGMNLVAGNGEMNWALVPTRDVSGCDPYAFVSSVNIYRRHLTGEQRRELVEMLLKARPEKSDRQIADEAKSNRNTVGQIRKKLERSGDVSRSDTRTDSKGRQQPTRKSSTKPQTKDVAVTSAADRAEQRAAKAKPTADVNLTEQEEKMAPAPDPVLECIGDDQARISVECLAEVLVSIRKAFDALDAKHRAVLLAGLRQQFHDIEGWNWAGPACATARADDRLGTDVQA